MYYRLLLYLFLLVPALGFSQDAPLEIEEDDYYNKVGLKAGYTGFRFRDRVVSTFLYRGGSVPVEINYSYHTPDFKTIAALIFSGKSSVDFKTRALDGFTYAGPYGVSIKDTIDNLDHKTLRGNYSFLFIDMLWKLRSWDDDRLKLFLGASYSYQILSKKFLMLDNSNMITDRSNNFGVQGLLEFRPFRRHIFSLGISIPVVSYFDRNLNLQYGKERSYNEWTSWNKYFSFLSHVQYTFRFSRRFSLEANYRFNYYQVNFPRKEQTVSEMLTAGINYYF